MSSPPRPFRLSDAMILVAAAAAGVAWTRFYWEHISRANGTYLRGDNWTDYAIILPRAAIPCLTMLAAAVLVCDLRRPRPSLRMIARRPGAAACLVVAAYLGSELVFAFLGWVGHAAVASWYSQRFHSQILRLFPPRHVVTVYALMRSGPAVAAAWLILVLTGRWRAERSCLDRTGRGVGVAFLLVWTATALWTAIQLS